ncbi:MAG: hypothetical protein ACK5LC_10280 [Coprobacillaceae bacterium]
MKKNKKITIIGIILTIVIAILIFIFVNNGSSKDSKKVIEESGIKVAQEFYQEYYYPLSTAGMDDQEIMDMMETKKETGIKISINDILKVSELSDSDDKKSLEKYKEEYDFDESYVIIYPSEKYTDKKCTAEITVAQIKK